MERIYGEQVEQRLFAVSGIREISQVARTGRIIATVVFEWDTDMDFALVDVEKAVGPIRSDPDVDEVLVRHFDPRQAAVLNVGLISDESGPDLAELRRIAKRQVAITLERLEGVAEVRVTGGRDKQIQVVVDRYKLDAHGITLQELEGRLRAANVDINAGTLEEGGRVFLVRGLARYRRTEDVAEVVVRFGQDAEGRRVPVRVSRPGRGAPGRRGDHPPGARRRSGGCRAGDLQGGRGQHGRGLRARCARPSTGLSGDLPGIAVRIVSDEAALVEDAISDVQRAALIGVALAMLVLILFLRSPGPTVIVATAVPVSLLATLFLMHFAGHTLNVMTLGGLALGCRHARRQRDRRGREHLSTAGGRERRRKTRRLMARPTSEVPSSPAR